MEEDAREVFQNPIQLSKGINVKELMAGQAEFHLDLDFKQTKDGIDLTEYGDMMPNAEVDDDSEDEDVFDHIEKKTEQMLLKSPECRSFEELASKMIDVPCQPSGAVKISILEEGDGPLIPPDAEVTMHYAAYWERASVPFDCSLTTNNGQPKYIKLGRGRILPGLEVALSAVRSPRARLLALLQPAAAWGATGAPPRIPPHPVLFVLVVDSVKEPAAAHKFNELSTEEKSKYTTTVQTVKSIRNTAKDLYIRKRYNKAIKNYQQAIHVLSLSRPETEQERKEIKKMKIQLFVNLAVCYYKLKKPQLVIDMCENIDKIILLETHCKGLFYYGRALEMTGKMDEAVTYYKKALKLEPNNKEIGRLLAEIDQKIVKSAENERQMWRKAFKLAPTDAKIKYTVDGEFENGVKDVCEDLMSRDELIRFSLPTGLTNDELTCVKTVVRQFSGLVLEESGEGKKRRVTLLKRID